MVADVGNATAAVDVTGLATVALTVATLVSVVVALLLGRHAARDATASRDAQTFLQIYQGYFRSPRGYRARRLIKNGFPEPPALPDQEIIAEAYGYYELLAIYIDEGLIDERLARKIFKGALSSAAERRSEWLQWWKTGGPRELYGVHLAEMVRRWPETTDDARPRGVLTRPYPGVRRGRLQQAFAQVTTRRFLLAFAGPLLAAAGLAVAAAARHDDVGAGVWVAALVVQVVVLLCGRPSTVRGEEAG